MIVVIVIILNVMPNTSVRFYSLNSMPRVTQNGAFLNLTTESGGNRAGLYYCYNDTWKYLVNLDNEIKSAAVWDNVIYFYNTAPAPSLSGVPSPSTYVFSVNLPNNSIYAGAGVSVSGRTVSVDLSQTAVTDGTTTPHTQSTNLLVIDDNGELSMNDTWDCGQYDEQLYKHIQLLKTSNITYTHVLKGDIPDNATVTTVASVPNNPSVSSPSYIQLDSGNHWYYMLTGKQPHPSSLKYGEVAVSYADGYERLYIKNSVGEIVEFEPANRRRNVVSNATFINDTLYLVDSEGTECRWDIPYADITEAGIGVSGAVVFLRENATGKQTVPDVVFNGVRHMVEITIYSTSNISPNTYTAIVMGSNYNNII